MLFSARRRLPETGTHKTDWEPRIGISGPRRSEHLIYDGEGATGLMSPPARLAPGPGGGKKYRVGPVGTILDSSRRDTAMNSESTPCCLSLASANYTLGPGFWAMTPDNRRSDLLRHQLERARQVIADYQLPVPESEDRLELVVLLAAEAEMLFFNAALEEPTREQRDRFFSLFIRFALQGSDDPSC